MATQYLNNGKSWNDYIDEKAAEYEKKGKTVYFSTDKNGQNHYSIISQDAANSVKDKYDNGEITSYIAKNGKLYSPEDSTTPQAETNAPQATSSVSENYSALQALAPTTSNTSVSDLSKSLTDTLTALGISTTAPTYTDKYADSLSSALSNYTGMTYDNFLQGSEYSALKDMYDNLGQNAMKNTLAQVAARTGGLASSYATTAADAAYNDYMNELTSAAMSAYQNQKSDAYNLVGLLQGLSDSDYSRYSDSLSQYNNDRSLAYNLLGDSINQQNIADQNQLSLLELANSNYYNDRDYNYQAYRDSVSDENYANELAYQKERDSIEDSRYDDETSYNRSQTEDETGYNRALAIAQYTGNFDSLKDYGWSSSDIKTAHSNWVAENTPSSSSSSKTTETKSKMYDTALKKAADYDDDNELADYLDNLVNSGRLTEEEATDIYLGVGGKPAATETPISEQEFNRSTAMQDNYGSYAQYLKYFYSK